MAVDRILPELSRYGGPREVRGTPLATKLRCLGGLESGGVWEFESLFLKGGSACLLKIKYLLISLACSC